MKTPWFVAFGALLGLMVGTTAFDCKPTPSPTPIPATDSAPACTLANCTCAAQNLAAMGCVDASGIPYSQPNDAGETFVLTCQSAQTKHIPVPVGCLSAAKSCAEAKSCH